MRDRFRVSTMPRPALATMNSSDKQNTASSTKPFTPALSTTSRSNKGSYPLTPRLAGTSGHQTPRKVPYTETNSPVSSSRKQDASNVGSTFLSTDATPRSGPQDSRRDETLSTIDNTHISSQHESQHSHPTPSPARGYRLDRNPTPTNGRTAPVIAEAKGVLVDDFNGRSGSRPGSSCESQGESPMFFHANDARSYDYENRKRSCIKLSQTPSFVYADGTREEGSQTDDSSNPLSVTKWRSIGLVRPTLAIKPTSIVPPRSKSPQTLDSEEKLTAEEIVPPNLGPENAIISASSQGLSPSLDQLEQEEDAIFVGNLPPHRKPCSLDSTQRLISGHRTRCANAPNPSFTEVADAITDPAKLGSYPSPKIVSNCSIDSTDPHLPFSLAPTPIKIEGNIQHGDGLTINARTERKVLDLEISNSSLLAINRTLERELRKQNTELRRYRRLSRSGRLSIATSLRSVSEGGLSVVSETEDKFSEQSSAHSLDELSDSSDNDSSSIDDGTRSPSMLIERDSCSRTGDGKRFHLDLAKHQELLIDSQKINQSLRRCLGWTEELIREGKKALAYHVHVNDVEIGGRVLAPDELSDDGDRVYGILDDRVETLLPLSSPIDELPETTSDTTSQDDGYPI